LIKAQDIEQVNKMGFDKANTSEELTNLYYKNQDAVSKLFYKLSDVVADYTVLAFGMLIVAIVKKKFPN
jgi:hypothetical protein